MDKPATGVRTYIKKVLSFLIAIVIAIGLTSILIYFSGYNTLEVFWLTLTGGFGSLTRLSLSLNEAAPLLLCTLGLIMAFKSGVWNIGAEGQLLLGAIGAALAGIFLRDIPRPLHLILVIIASFVFGAIWGAVPGVLKARFNTNEIITSLLMNFIAIWILTYLVHFPLENPESWVPVSKKIASTARLPVLISGTSLHIGILLALALSVVVWFIFQKTAFGYRLKCIGKNPYTALYGGISVKRLIVISMILSGGLAGLAGMSQVSGVHYLLAEYISPANYGFLAIPVVFIARLNPFGAVLASIFFGGLLTGSYYVQMNLGIDPTVISTFVALVMISLMLDPFIERSLSRIF